MAQGAGIGAGILEGYIPEFNFIFIVAAVTQKVRFSTEACLFQNIFDIQIFQRGKLPVEETAYSSSALKTLVTDWENGR